jgi:hypothetical protein
VCDREGEETKRSGDLQQGSMKRGKQDHSTERGEDGYNRAKQDDRRPRDDSRWGRDDRGKNVF